RAWPWLLGLGAAASVVLALLAGGAVAFVQTDPLGWFHRPPPPEVTATPPSTVDLPAAETPPDTRKWEEELVRAAKRHPNPELPRQGGQRRELMLGLDPRVELGLFYLDQNRL